MFGTVRIQTFSGKIDYDIILKQKFTFIRGDSGTGKSAFYRVVHRYLTEEDFEQTDRLVFEGCRNLYTFDYIQVNFEKYLLQESGNVIIVDEKDLRKLRKYNNQVKGKGNILSESDNYFILIGREPYSDVAYSCKEIYEMSYNRNEIPVSKYPFPDIVPMGEKGNMVYGINSLKRLYDEGSGKEFFTRVLKEEYK